MNTSKLLEHQSKIFALYVLESRALPALTDGLKPSGRRVLWMARDGHKHKTATLAGITMAIHPHGEASGAINTLAAPYGNNYPIFDGMGAFGTLIDPTAYGASRYTHVKLSEFTKDVILKDLDIIPMVDNYDSTQLEPKHFLPLIPTVLINPTEGVAIGFACNILPRKLKDIIEAQILILNDLPIKKKLVPTFLPINAKSTGQVYNEKTDSYRWVFNGDFKKLGAQKYQVTKLPYGMTHTSFIQHLIKLTEKEKIVDFDDNSRDTISIEVKTKRDIVLENNEDILDFLNLTIKLTENSTMLDLDHTTVLANIPAEDAIERFTMWRLSWYKIRYEHMLRLKQEELQKYKDVSIAIKHNVASSGKTCTNRAQLKELITKLNIINVDYIADLPTYRYTKDEFDKVQNKILECEKDIQYYNSVISDKNIQRNIYMEELVKVLDKYA